MTNQPRAALYARVSVADEAESTAPGTFSPSVARQLKLLRALAEREGYVIAAEFVDDGISGYRTEVDRPGFDALTETVASGAVDVVLAVAQDRLSRQTVQTLTFKALCAQHSVTWHLLEQGRVQHDDDLMTTVLAALAQQESKTKQQRLLRANADRAARGAVHRSSRRPFGYFKGEPGDARNYVTTVPTEAAAIRAAFTDYATTNMTLGQIRDRWNSAGLTTTTGQPWTSGRVGLVLRNPRYAGWRVHQGRRLDVRGEWEAITDDETFDLVQARLATNVAGRKPRESTPTTLLGGIATCHCGSFLRPANGGRRNKDGVVVSVYRCHRQPLDKEGRHAVITAQNLDAYVTRLVADEILIGHAIDRMGTETSAHSELLRLKADETELMARLQRVRDGYVAGILDATESARRVKGVEQRLEMVRAQITSVRAQMVDSSWIERARAVAENSEATTLDAAVDEFAALPLMQRRGIIENLFDVVVLPGLTKPATGKRRGVPIPIAKRAFIVFKAEPQWEASEPGPTA